MTTELQPGPSLASTDRDCPRVTVLDGQDQFDGMEEQVCRGVVEHLRGAFPAYLPTTDDDSGDDEQTATQHWKTHKGTLDNLWMADHTVIKWVTWPHKLIYMPSSQPAI